MHNEWFVFVYSVLGDQVVTTGGDDIIQWDGVKILPSPNKLIKLVLLVLLVENILGSDQTFLFK